MKNVWIILAALLIAYWFLKQEKQPDAQESFSPKQNSDAPVDVRLGDATVVLYYADWCPHCVRFKPVWSFVKSRMESDKVHFTEVDCTDADNEIRTPQGTTVPGFPSVYMYRNGREHSYEGRRDTEEVLKWIRSIA